MTASRPQTCSVRKRSTDARETSSSPSASATYVRASARAVAVAPSAPISAARTSGVFMKSAKRGSTLLVGEQAAVGAGQDRAPGLGLRDRWRAARSPSPA